MKADLELMLKWKQRKYGDKMTTRKKVLKKKITTKNMGICAWCGELVPKNTLEEAGGGDIIPAGLKVCEKCINLPKAY